MVLGTWNKETQTAKLLATEKPTFQLRSQADSNRRHSTFESSERCRQSESEQSGGEI